jgi:hypothetical protein
MGGAGIEESNGKSDFIPVALVHLAARRVMISERPIGCSSVPPPYALEQRVLLDVLCPQENCTDFEGQVSAQCDSLVEAIHRRKQELLEFIRQNKEMKLRTLKDQVSTCTCKLQHTTGLLQFCIEALKETDSAAFLQVSSCCCTRSTQEARPYSPLMDF